MTAPMPWLTDAEVDDLCFGLVRNDAKIRHLQGLGLTVNSKPNGRALVVRAHAMAVLNPQPVEAPPATEPAPAAPTLAEFEDSPLGQAQKRWREARAEIQRAREEELAAMPQPTRQELKAAALELQRRQREARAAIVRFHAAQRRVAKLQRTPPWADEDLIRAVYRQARELTVSTGVMHHVDHIIPLQGRLVSGLHVHTNLQILPWRENVQKKNRFDVTAGESDPRTK